MYPYHQNYSPFSSVWLVEFEDPETLKRFKKDPKRTLKKEPQYGPKKDPKRTPKGPQKDPKRTLKGP